MTTLDKIVHACATGLAALLVGIGVAHAQPAAQSPAANAPPGPAPTGLVVGSGNFYSPIVANLEEAVAFYRDGIGFEVRGEPTNADANPQLMKMFGLQDARLRQQIGRALPTPGGVEIVELSGASGERVERGIQDPGTVMLLVSVRDIDATLARLKRLGAPVITSGGAPMALNNAGFRGVLVQDPAGHFVEILQTARPRPAAPGENANIVDVRVRHTVENLERSIQLYRGALGLQGPADAPPYTTDSNVARVLGLPQGTQWRYTTLTVPTSGLLLELIEFKGSRRPAAPARVHDPGSTRMQLRVSDIDAAVAALVQAGGTFMSTGGQPLDLPAGNGILKVGIVRDPDGLFVVLIQAPPAPR
jgi:catechol 2,3-dioxygenase-like lactoylglutathione lyase family enzyme